MRRMVEEDFAVVEPAAAGEPPRRAILIATAAMWGASIAVTVVRSALETPHPNLWLLLLVRIAVASFGCVLCFLIHLVLKRLERQPFWVKGLATALMLPFVADGFIWVSSWAARLIEPMPWTDSPSEVIFSVVYYAWFFLAWSAIYLALNYAFAAREQERRWRAMQGLAHEAQMRALHNQISPHFFFNTLNSLSALILDRRTEEAEAMVSRLSRFFRASLGIDPMGDLKLEEEIALQSLYLEIERVRFPDLSFEVDVGPGVGEALVPPLILQPLVENAVKFAVARSLGPARIELRARAEGDWLALGVRDDGASAPGPERGTGTGLKNVRERLAVRFGEDFVFSAGPAERGFLVSLVLPLRFG